MPKLFGVDIASEVNKAMGAGLLPATLTKNTPGTRDSANPTGGKTNDTGTFACRGFIEDYDVKFVNGTTILETDRKVLLLGASLPVGIIPSGGDAVTIEGATYNIVHVKRDPAAATYTCQVRK